MLLITDQIRARREADGREASTLRYRSQRIEKLAMGGLNLTSCVPIKKIQPDHSLGFAKNSRADLLEGGDEVAGDGGEEAGKNRGEDEETELLRGSEVHVEIGVADK